MKQVINELKTRLREAITLAFGNDLQNVDPAVNQASNTKFGDFQSNVALTMSKQLGKQPRQIADEIIGKLALDGICEAPTVAGPGFINFQLKQAYLEEQLTKLHADERLGVPSPERARKVIVDMSSPNIAKEMHVGHLRSTIIGDSIARIYEFLGHDVLRINHVGDWGTQFGMLIAELKEKYPKALTQSEALDLGDLVVFYKQAKKHFDDDPQFQDTARKEVVKLQSGEAESTSAWQMLCAQSRKSFQQIYDKLHIRNLVERGESFYNDKLEDVVQLLREKGLAVESDGAICVFLDGFLNEEGKPLPLIIKKKDGGYNYATTDLASIIYRVNQDKGDDLIYVVDAGQALHFDMVIKAARQAGFVPEHLRVEHVPFGVVQGEDGKKLKTRSGETVRLQDLIDEAIRHAREDLDARLKERGREESEEFRSKLAEAIGLGAIKYADLSLNRMTNYIFSFKKMLSLQGNTAPYMMYAYVRVLGISREGGVDFSNLSNTNLSLSDPAEQALAKQLLRLDSVLDSVVAESLPNRICEYLFELSQTFNQFYENCPVLDAPEPHRTTRLVLCNLTARMIKVGLALLGIDVVERM